MSGYDYIAQGVGLLACVLIVFSCIYKSDKYFKIFNMLGSGTFAVHFIMLGASAGAAVAFLNAARSGLSVRFHNSNIILGLFLVFYLIIGTFFYTKPVDLLPILAGAFTALGMYKLSGIHLRICFLLTALAWLIYSIYVMSLGVFITNIFIIGTNLVTIYRLVQDGKKEQIV